jgi:autotransporter-associated beta strand protein
VEVFGNGNLDISAHNAPGVTVGSIEGSGNVFLGANNLTVGSNNLSTTFSGVIQDGGFNGGAGGSLTKIGTGTLSLTNSNTYSGGTLINAGTLIAAHDGALGSGNVSLTAAGVTLTLQSGATNNYISDHSSISIVNGATANLNFTGASDVVGGIVLNGFNETTPGTYGSATSGAMFESVFFSGTGTLLLVPEPATWTLMVLGMAMLTVMRFRRPRS